MTASQTEPVTRQPRPRHHRTARWPWYLLRTVTTALAVDIFLQSVFAGRFLSGDYPQLRVHRTNAIVVAAVAVVLVVAAVLAWRVAGAPAVDIRPAEAVVIVARFTGYRGRYVMHCHNLEHEDMAMMATVIVQ
jgi:hypothetical protein